MMFLSLLFRARDYCWPCSLNKCYMVDKKDPTCSCCRNNHVR